MASSLVARRHYRSVKRLVNRYDSLRWIHLGMRLPGCDFDPVHVEDGRLLEVGFGSGDELGTKE